MRYSGNIRKNLEHLKIHFNEDAVVVLTTRDVPIQLKFVASLGKTFNYCTAINDCSAIDTFICMNKVVMGCSNYNDKYHTKREFSILQRQMESGTLKDESPTEAQLYISELMSQAFQFLKKNKEVIVISSDKGGKVVIMERKDYVEKMNGYLNENIAVGNYQRINDETLPSIRSKIEICYAETISLVNPFLLADGVISNPLTLDPYIIPLLYGGPKIHKKNAPMRPIVASTDMIGTFLSGWLLEKLQLIAARLSKYNVPNSKQLVTDLKDFVLEPDHVNCSFGYVSMFTNVDVTVTISVVSEFYSVVAETTSVPLDVFVICLEFFIQHATYFMFNGNIFKQVKGLAMGNRLAQVLAEIRTNYALHNALKDVGADVMSLMYKYVDDIFTSIHKDHIDTVVERVSKDVGMELTVTREDSNSEVEFLDCVFRRNQDSTVSHRWFKKSYSSLSILNFHSYHPVVMKKNVILELIRNAFEVTSPEFMNDTELLLRDILHRSSYPEALTNGYIKPFTSFKMPKDLDYSHRYVSCPYFKPSYERIKSTIYNRKLNVKLAPKPFSNNRRILFSRIKDIRDASSIKNSVFKICCNDCPFAYVCTTKNFDIQRTFQRIVIDDKSVCGQHVLKFPDHSMDKEVIVIKTFHNKFDTEQSRYFTKQIEMLQGKRIMLE
ncbi:MAG TPA: hypothetical protein VGC17_01715 [Lactovum miscens]|uniref:hypothetical protein n=1 Tax=Lactovum miscens TaxID=190387 RepID=UPI002ED77736